MDWFSDNKKRLRQNQCCACITFEAKEDDSDGKRSGMDEKQITNVLERDYSEGTEEFREGLLARCLDVLDAGDEINEVGDEDLEMLAAAGIFEVNRDDDD